MCRKSSECVHTAYANGGVSPDSFGPRRYNGRYQTSAGQRVNYELAAGGPDFLKYSQLVIWTDVASREVD